MKKLGDNLQDIVNSVRATESAIEQVIFRELNRTPPFVLCRWGIDQPTGEGYFFFPQVTMHIYRLDFLVMGIGYPPRGRVWPPRLKAMVAVECDGADFHTAPEDVEYDRLRDEYFLTQNIKTIRLRGSTINKYPAQCVQEIIDTLHEQMKVK